jgi:uncharacterized protein YcgI (DUF1989 family)
MIKTGNALSTQDTMQLNVIPPCSAIAFIWHKNQELKIVDLEGEQVADLVCFNLDDSAEYLSSGRTIDYAESIYFTTGSQFYSNRSNVMFEMMEDTVRKHDFLLTPCSREMFQIIYGMTDPPKGCFGNLSEVLLPYGIMPDQIPVCFNVFMNVDVNGTTGKVSVLPPKSRAGDYVVLKAKMDMIVGITACSAGMSNNFRYKPIGYKIFSEE